MSHQHDRPPDAPPATYRYDVALSLAGEQRWKLDELDQRLTERLGPGRVFYYPRYESTIAGANSDLTLYNIYRHQSKLVIPCMSAEYKAKN